MVPSCLTKVNTLTVDIFKLFCKLFFWGDAHYLHCVDTDAMQRHATYLICLRKIE